MIREHAQRFLPWIAVVAVLSLIALPAFSPRPLPAPVDAPVDAPEALAMAGSGGNDFFTTVPSEVTDLVNELLPEYSNAGASYVSAAYSPNLVITQDATVDIIFVWEGAGYRNSLGWFSYTETVENGFQITDANIIWDNVSFPGAGSMQTGDTHTLEDAYGDPKVFVDGERVGFFVCADGFRRSTEVMNWDPLHPSLPKLTPSENAAVGGGYGCYTSRESLNPEYASGAISSSRHLAMIKVDGMPGFLDGEDFIISGFEDLNRTRNSDDDFNDLVFIVDPTPLEAIEDTEVFVFKEGDPDGDGVEGIDDHFPNDPERAFISRYPSHGHCVIGFEDQYPRVGDADYNDAAIAYVYEITTHANGKIKDIQADFHLMARGAGLDHSFGLHFPDLDASATGTLQIERFLSDDLATHQSVQRTIQEVVAASNRIDDVIPSTRQALPGVNSVFTNTNTSSVEREAASMRVLMTFDTPLASNAVGTAPYDLWFGIPSGGGLIDVHFPGFEGFSNRFKELPHESGEQSFMDDDDYPWMIEVPSSWSVPLEKVHIETAYPKFHPWRQSNGKGNRDWYDKPGGEDKRAASLGDYIPVRDWAIGIPRDD